MPSDTCEDFMECGCASSQGGHCAVCLRPKGEHQPAQGGGEPEQAAQKIIEGLCEEYPDDDCADCQDCGRMVMCRFHSVMSVLRKRTWTTGAIERDGLQRELASLRTALAQMTQERDEARAELARVKGEANG